MKYSDKKLKKELKPYLDKEGKFVLKELLERIEDNFSVPFEKFFLYPLEDAYNKFIELVLIDKDNMYSYMLCLNKNNKLNSYYIASGITTRILKEL